ncbi:hypothetical protein MNB_SM-7-334 [hydrothermal vent metagenome]|uniref:Uncharacterized protein n=1 Tax=hydrothermal vent metagenome TaxID=652676 RepID=A0A1W1BDL0_9ZZZZ
MTIVNNDAVLTKLGYNPSETLRAQLDRIKSNTKGYEKIIKHILDLHDALQVDKSYVALSNSKDYLKIKVEAQTPEMKEETLEKIERFKEKYKVDLQKVDGKDTYYIIGFAG